MLESIPPRKVTEEYTIFMMRNYFYTRMGSIKLSISAGGGCQRVGWPIPSRIRARVGSISGAGGPNSGIFRTSHLSHLAPRTSSLRTSHRFTSSPLHLPPRPSRARTRPDLRSISDRIGPTPALNRPGTRRVRRPAARPKACGRFQSRSRPLPPLMAAHGSASPAA